MILFKFAPANGLNFGDELGPLIVKSLLKKFRLKFAEKNSDKRLLSVGSVLHLSAHDDFVWGSGINGKVPLPINTISRNYLAVRGPQTQKILVQNGIDCPSIFGDPAIILPNLYKPVSSTHSTNKVVVIPNYNDFSRLKNDISKHENEAYITLLHPFMPPLIMIDLIASAKAVITSSLHAKIIADSYKVPNAVLGGDGYAEHPFKYLDYVEGIEHRDLKFCSDIASGLKNIENPLQIKEEIIFNLLKSFPVELFDAS